MKYIFLAIILLVIFASPACATYYAEGTHLSELDGADNDDNHTGPLNIGFTFPFYDTNYTQFNVTTNGIVSFDGANDEFTNTALNTTAYNYAAVFAFWDDMIPTNDVGGGYIVYDTIAAGEYGNPYGSDVLVVQWTNYEFFGLPLVMGTFQVHLLPDGNITFNYNYLISDNESYGISATIGIQENGTGNYVQHSYDTDAGIRNGYAISFAYDDGINYTKSEASTAGFWDILLYKAGSVAPPSKPSNPNPSVGATTSTSPTLSWSADNATNYTVRIATDTEMSSLFSTNSTTVASLSVSGLSENTTYYWDVEARNDGGEAHSDVWNFITGSVPVANFTSNITSGALPLAVNFTDLSTNTPTSWAWDFGDGGNSTDQNPLYVYTSVGTYNVTLNATNADGSDATTRTNYITVAIAPVAGFSSNVTSGAVPLSVNFTDESANSPSSWFWDFGDGSNSTSQNPIHNYTSVGTYTVSLNATNVGGSNISTQLNYITAAEVPVANFSANVTSGAVPLSVNFTDMSTNAPVSWFWDFGDGTNSSIQNATHTYTSVGTYNVSLNVTNVGGSNFSMQTNYITVAIAPVAGFSSNVTSGAVPLSVNFTDESANSPTSWFWDFGDGSNSTSQNPIHNYTYVGTYTVSLNATNVGGSNISTQLNYITAAEVPVANFSANVTSGAVPLSVNFTDLSTNAPVSWFWDFGDGSNSSIQNATHTYTSAGSYNVSLNASNLGGYNISIQTAYITTASVPVAGFTSNVTSGAAPLSVNFTDQSTNATSWYWEFGDGTNSTDQNPTYAYTDVGTYNVSLTAINAISGNDTLTEVAYITVAIAPVANFTADVTSGTAPLAVSFTDLSTNTPTSWAWNFGDGANSTVQNATHTYASAGTYTVVLNATNVGGSNTSTQIGYITVTAVSSSSSGSDSSYRASVSPGQQPDIVKSTETSVTHVMGGTSVEFDLSGGDDPVLGISFDAKDNEGLVVTKVQVLNERPSDVPAPQGNSYSVMSIDVGATGTISEHNADNIIIRFKVSREWIEQNNIDPETIRLTRYHGEEWQDLPSYQEREEDGYLYFYAETPGFSIFSVVGDTVGAEDVESEPELVVSEEGNEPVTEETPDTPGFTGMVSLVFVTLAFLVLRKHE
ncbi:PKD domain-containing protein [uncultured Methanolobus sp.]|uniref:PKD domain-containing protein n=1 Tax=uncultured Methanolobus sp. TaxID=218300 RepID=UPI0029C72DF4|nr:PKD domain-containing protein [uncultured Methanolobus sp.]